MGNQWSMEAAFWFVKNPEGVTRFFLLLKLWAPKKIPLGLRCAIIS